MSGYFSLNTVDGQHAPAIVSGSAAETEWLLFELLAFDGAGVVTITSQTRRGATSESGPIQMRTEQLPYRVSGDSIRIGSADVAVVRRGSLELVTQRYVGRRLTFGRAKEL